MRFHINISAFLAPRTLSAALPKNAARDFHKRLSLRLGSAVLLAGLAACAPATSPKPDLNSGASTEGNGNILPDEAPSGYVSWNGEGRLEIAPPLEILQEIQTRCKDLGFDLGYVTSISLEETNIKAAFNCRGAS